MGVMAYFPTDFAPIIEHLFFQELGQHLVDVQNEHTYGKLCLSWVRCLSTQSTDVEIDDITIISLSTTPNVVWGKHWARKG